MTEYILQMKSIDKEFSGVKALDNVNLNVKKGEIHALCGENGAGKSTLMNVLSGVFSNKEYSGEIIYKGQICNFSNIKDSENVGISIIHQELALIPEMSIAENIFLGNELTRHNVIDWDQTISEAKKLSKLVGLEDDVNTQVKQIGIGKQQLVEIAKALSKNVDLLILDEPTAALNETDSENLLNLLKEFQKQGMTCIIISHKLNEVMQVSDSVTILRDGKTIETLPVNDQLTEERIIKGMVGRDLDHRYPPYEPKILDTYFEVKNWNVDHPTLENKKVIKNIDFSIKRGEIVGIAGLMGAGRTEFAKSVFGSSYGKNITGTVALDGQEIDVSTVNKAIDNGLAYVTEDRQNDGLVLIDNILRNITMASLEKVSRHSVIDEYAENTNAEYYKNKMNIKCQSLSQTVESLSGGNQQKVVLAKWILSGPEVLFLDEPTRGIDVGAKYEIYSIIQELALSGKSVCIISSELPEILGMCDRIYTMNNGKLTGEFQAEEANQEVLMRAMT